MMQARSVTSYTQDQFDLLWADCRAQVVGGTMPIEDADECKSQVFNSMNSQPIKMAVADSQSKDISYLAGYKTDDNHFYVVSGFMVMTLVVLKVGYTQHNTGQPFVSGWSIII